MNSESHSNNITDGDTVTNESNESSARRLLKAGEFLGDHGMFRLEKHMGKGGMGEVWLATEIQGGIELRQVICKIIPAEVQLDEEELDRIKKTFDLTKNLHHEYICPLYGMYQDRDYGWFFVMGYADGGDLSKWFRSFKNYAKGIPFEQVLKVAGPLAKTLDYAHKNKVIHRDVKPQNVMFRKQPDGRYVPWLIDFGISARIHETNTKTRTATGGTPVYMPPEQWTGSTEQGSRTDQYSFAMMLYQFLNGALPFKGQYAALMYQVLSEVPASIPHVPPHVNFALLKALSKNPADRFNNCVEFVMALQGKSKTDVHATPNTASNPGGLEETVSLPAISLPAEAVPTVTLPAVALPTVTLPIVTLPTAVLVPTSSFERLSFLITARRKQFPSITALFVVVLILLFFLGIFGFRLALRTPERPMESTAVAPKLAPSKPIAPPTSPVVGERSQTSQIAPSELHPPESPLPTSPLVNPPPPSIEGWVGSQGGDRNTLTINGIEYAFRWCPAGNFMMGSPEDEIGRYSGDETQCYVKLTQGFWILETEVTQSMWESVMGDSPSCFKGEKLPVEQVSWNDCQEFITKLNAIFSEAPADWKFSLPTDAQWEYACRAGTTTALNSGKNISSKTGACNNLAELGWYSENSDGTSKAVGQKKANAWGLYDMHGNVWEWCLDVHNNMGSVAIDPVGSGTSRGFRGGSWTCIASNCRSASIGYSQPVNRISPMGLRICLSVNPPLSLPSPPLPKPIENETAPKNPPENTAKKEPVDLKTAALAIKKAPSGFQETFVKVMAEIKEKGGFAVAGQVVNETGSPIQTGEITVALYYNECNAEDTYRFPNGWFITRRAEDYQYDEVVVAGFFHKPTRVPAKIIDENQFELTTVKPEKCAEKDLTSLSGKVTDDAGKPIANADVHLTLYRSNGYFESPATLTTVTDKKGNYKFSKIMPQEYSLSSSRSGHEEAFCTIDVTQPGSKDLTIKDVYAPGVTPDNTPGIANLVLSSRHKVTIEYVYPLGPNAMTTPKTIILESNSNFIVATGETGKYGPPDDLRLQASWGDLFFRHFHANGTAGHYDAGEISFDSITQIDESQISEKDSLCLLNHVYCLRTYYGEPAKFIVRKIEIIPPE